VAQSAVALGVAQSAVALGVAQSAVALGVAQSATGRAWSWRATDERAGLMLAQRLDIPELVGRLLAARGIGPDTAGDFLTPKLRALLPDPAILRDMDEAAARIAEAVRRDEAVAVFADYDVDGACSGALMVQGLRDLGCGQVSHYVPDRLREGYGPNAPAIASLCDAGARLIICVDCGIAAHAALAAAQGRADVVVRSDGLILFTDPPFGLNDAYNGVQRKAEIGFSGVYAFDEASGRMVLIDDQLDRPNGIALSPD
jgi:hypothetical protein